MWLEREGPVNPLISVVIPIYNVEKYLNRCVDSIVNQTYQNLEILLVDDGSPDNCPQMCDSWAEKDARIRVFHKQNAGLGMARNTGIENATGKYVCFFDSDDFVEEKTIEYAFSLAERETADVVVFGMTKTDADGNALNQRIPCTKKDVYNGEEVRSVFLADLIGADPKTGANTYLTASACMAMYSSDLIRRANWRFVSERDIISEDVFSLLELYQYVNKVAVLKEALYFYRGNDHSLSTTYRINRYEESRTFYQKCLELCEMAGYSENVKKRCMSPFLGNAISAMKQEVNEHTAGAAIARLKKIIEDPLMQNVMHEKKRDKVSVKVRLLFWTIRNKYYGFCYLLLHAQNRWDNRKRVLKNEDKNEN